VAAFALAQPALAAYPYTSGSPTGAFDTFKTGAGVTPNDIDHGDSDWKFAATPEAGSPNTADPTELNGVRGAHVVDAEDAVETAWMITTGRPDVSIAVLDSGIKWNDAGAMADLRLKTRLNQGELPTPNAAGPALIAGVDCTTYAAADDANGDHVFDLRDFACDDRVDKTDPRRAGPADVLTPQDLLIAFSNGDDADGNGYRDDIAGWDFLDDDNDAFDDVQYGHGTGEAEDSVGEVDNDNGLPGACPNCTFVPLRVGDSFVADVNRFALAAIYATDNGIPIIQEALGTLNNSALGRRAVEYAYRHGTTVIASAADEAAQHHNWPSSYPHTVVVNSVEKYDGLSDSKSYLQFNGCTNFSTHVTLAIPSTSCSSNATGLAAGMAGLVLSAALNAGLSHPNCTRVDGSHCPISPNEVRQLMASGELTPMVGGAESPDTTGLSDDVDFLGDGLDCSPLPSACDPNRNFAAAQLARPIVGPAMRSYPARAGHDQYYGYGRVNMLKAVRATVQEKIPPEAEITAPDWYAPLDPNAGSVEVRGEMWARGDDYTCTIEVAPGSEPNNATEFEAVPSPVCDGSTERSAAFDGVVASLDVAALKARFPDGTDFEGAAPPPQGNVPVPADTGPHLNNRPNQEPFGFTLRLRVTKVVGADTLTGQDRRNAYLHRDADTLDGWPKRLPSDGASSPALADLDGDNRNELVFGTSDGTVHALRRDGSELAGWPVRGDPLPIHPGQHAFGAGGIPEGLSHGAMLSSPAVGDMDHDGAPEVAIADLEGKVYVWSATGELVWKREANPDFSGRPLAPFENVRQNERHRTQHGFIASPVLADLDASGDGRLELVAAGMDRHVYAWHAGGAAVDGYPALVVDRDKVASIDGTTHRVNFRPDGEIGGSLQQGAIVNTPAVGDLDGDEKPEIVVGTNEEYPEDLNSGATTPSGALLQLLQDQLGLDTGNTRVYALKTGGDPGAPSPDNSIFLWVFKPGVMLTELLPLVGEGVNSGPVIARTRCGGPEETPAVGVSAAVGFAYLLKPDGTSCYGQTGGKDNALHTEFAVGAGKYDTPALAAVGHGAFAQLDPAGGPSFVTPVAGIVRALDAALNEYQGGQDLLAAWNTETGQFRPGWPTPVNDLQFLTGPASAEVDGNPGQEVLGGSASLDLNAVSAAGTPIPGWPKFTADWMVADPAIGSFGVDETADDATQTVVAATRAGTVFAYDTGAPACSDASWPRFHHDNANSGVFERDAVSPGKPYDPAVTSSEIAFKAPGDDLLCGTVEAYEVATSGSPIAPDLSGATKLDGPLPAEPGSVQELSLSPGFGRYVAIRAVDEQGNVGRALVIDRLAGAGGGPGGPGNPGGPGGEPEPPAGGPGAGCAGERERPLVTRLRRPRARPTFVRVRGRARDRGCAGVKRVLVAVAKKRHRRCRFITRRGTYLRARSCKRPHRLRAFGATRFSLRVNIRLRRGHHVVSVRAVDAMRNRSKRRRATFRVR
jgi:hypothetical protein